MMICVFGVAFPRNNNVAFPVKWAHICSYASNQIENKSVPLLNAAARNCGWVGLRFNGSTLQWVELMLRQVAYLSMRGVISIVLS